MEYQKIAEATVIWLVIKITKALQNSKQNNSETVTNKYDKEIPKDRPPEEGQKIIDNLRLNMIV